MIKRKDQKYRKWLRSQPCSNCSLYFPGQMVVAHQRILGRGGMGLKPPDKDALSNCQYCHNLEHRSGAITAWGQGDKLSTKVYIQELCDKSIKKYQTIL